jgi:hypothetical protein
MGYYRYYSQRKPRVDVPGEGRTVAAATDVS